MSETKTNVNTVEDAIRDFAAAIDEPPEAGLRWSLAHWGEAAPRFLSMLEAYVDGSDAAEQTTDAIIFIVHLLGDKGEQRAYRPLCRLMLNEQRLISALGDEATVDTLKGVVIRCFDGDLAPLREVIESPDAESITRGEALFAHAWLARDGQCSEAEFKEYMRHLLATMRPRGQDYIWYNWIIVAAILGYREFDADAEKLFADGWVPEEWMTKDELPELVAQGDPEGKSGLETEGIVPFENVLDAFADWQWPDDDEADEPPEEPYVNPFRNVGRNDPCPCGSGKKFKNCHLVLE